MKKILSMFITAALTLSAVMILAGFGGPGRIMQSETEEQTAEDRAEHQGPMEPGAEVMGIIRYSRTELGMLTEFDVSNHQVNENGQITQFDLHRTRREKVLPDGSLLQDVDSEDSTISLEYGESGDILSARTDIPGYCFTVHELTYTDGLIDTDAYDTDWCTSENPYKLQFTYEQSDGTVKRSEGKRLAGQKSSYPCEYEYNETGDVTRIIRTASPEFIVYMDIEYDENGCVTKITGTNPRGVFLICTFEYESLGEVGKAGTAKSGFRKWQEFSVIEEALKNCY